MSTFTQKKCPTCGGRVENISGNQYECRCCHNVYELNERNANLYHDLQVASTFRESLNFKQAELMYKNLLKEYKDDNLADVYWNLLLCEQRVMFESNEKGEQFPSFYDIVPMEIEESENYNKTIEYLNKFSPQNIGTYVELVDKMYTAKRKCRTIKNTSKPYDIFICFKKSKLDGEGVTEEYKLAFDLYNILSKDYNVFFSERSLNNIVVREYEPNIYHALYTAKIMLVLCSKREYLESQWVKNEWSRFKMFSTTTSQTKAIIPIFVDGFQENALPDEIRTCQGIRADYSLTESLKSAVKAILNPTDRQAEMAAKLKAEMQAKNAEMEAKMQEQMKAQMEAFAKQFAAQNAQQSARQTAPVDVKSTAQPKPVVQPKPVAPPVITEIKDGEFKNRTDLTTYVIPDTVTRIGNEAFFGCTNLKSITIPNSVTSIGDDAFSGCGGLTSVTIPNSVVSIGSSAFSGCSGLTEMTIPFVGSSRSATGMSILTLFGYIFGTGNYNGGTETKQYFNSTSYIIYYIPKSLKKVIVTGGNILREAFYNCANIESVTIGSGVTSIGDDAFSGCSGLRIINWFATACTTAGSCFYPIFSDCTSLTTVNIGANVKKISEFAFSGCSGLTSITVAQGNSKYHSDNNCLIETESKTLILGCKTSIIPTDGSVTSIGKEAFRGCSGLTNVIIPDSVMSIGDDAFSGCSGLTTINWNATACTTAGSYSNPIFSNCTNLTTVKIGDNVTSISDNAFYECSGLTSVTIGNSVKSIGKDAFRGCSELTSVTIPNSVTYIGTCAFYECSGLKAVCITDISRWCEISFGDSSANPLCYAHNLYLNGELVADLVIPDSVTCIGERVFYECTGLTSVKISSSVTSIGEFAFHECSGLTSVTIPESVTSIGYAAFSGCSGLKEITIPFVGESRKTATDKNQYPFGYIFGGSAYTGGMATTQNYYGRKTSSTESSIYYIPTSLQKVTVAGGDIPCGAFENCSNLTSITMLDGVTSIGKNSFKICCGLTSVTIPNSVTSIGVGAFFRCEKLTSITIGNKVLSIGASSFESCIGLKSVTIPASVTNIGRYTFLRCKELESINYSGTKKQWKKIDKDKDWDEYTSKYIVHCTDGDLKKSIF